MNPNKSLPSRSSARAIAIATAFAILVGTTANSQKNPSPTPPESLAPIPHARINTAAIRMPIIDGTDIRFMRPYSSDLLSQTVSGLIVQDDLGFIWFGTPNGLKRFDGYAFKTFVYNPGNPGSLSGAYVSALFKDRDGNLWVACNQFLNRFSRATETFARYPVPYVVHISQDSAGLLWLATRDSRYKLDPTTGKTHQYSHESNDPSSLSSNNVRRWSGEDRAGNFWVTNSAGLEAI